jgi:uncharacterized membrane protein HdeD (DUF308 family)
MDEIGRLCKNMITVVGVVEMLKNFDKQKKVPGFVWVIVTVLLGTLSVMPFVPEIVLDAALVSSVCTLFYDVILQNIKKAIAKKFGGNDE